MAARPPRALGAAPAAGQEAWTRAVPSPSEGAPLRPPSFSPRSGGPGAWLARRFPGARSRLAASLHWRFWTEALRQALERLDERELLCQARQGLDVCWAADDEPEPLVTVRIATYDRGELVAKRALASALAQTYRRLEILVVGDHCDQRTAEAVLSVRDPRVRFVNLAWRGQYPEDPKRRWMVAGAAPMNVALWLAQGKWIAPCDDDDELSPDHVEVLLEQARQRRLELVWSKASMEVEPGRWVEAGSEPLRLGAITHGSVLYSARLRFFHHSTTSWRLGQPSDWNLWSRMRRAGVRMGFVDRLTYVHYLESTQRLAPPSPARLKAPLPLSDPAEVETGP